MNRYEAVHQAVASDPVLLSLGLGATYRGNAVEDPTESVFAVVVWAATSPSFREAATDPQDVTVWFYQPRGSYQVVSKMLDRLRAVMRDLAGSGVAQVERRGDSGDLYDDRWDRATRNGTYTVH